ncbi:arginine-ornithine antiporter [Corynebacterium uberis]|uniref:arginine-ornithine antiporter n=1 Tax=Corynebacterium TaxID=1716 RepID=UPI001D0B1EA1|nr:MULTISPECIES: arginine-ornithine antiporter [Corynebacterium]MCZ9309775.1 arginine-ornithine antiporter [Corynebacterium sp. c6VSa_13]UDL73577.1 arginine-ornithine antiporter [Corynebacterium uberis]UDL75543.1 arginine-ornithine antiporter [Corynebacterium uberis]UDL77756.1 arginine-ornithine antiporter [Corynebacterium uberis]UDL80039.1 arginine-ornithine antiporter [Corynebacterium uberis]
MQTENVSGSGTAAAPESPTQGGAGAQGLSFFALLALVVGSMIGGGIFSLPQNIASVAAPGPIIIGWTITGVGMVCLALVYQFLSMRKPNLDNGIYAYARAGFGDFVGFNSAWGYWLSAFIGNVGYLVLLFSTLGKFFPIFEGGNTLPAIIGASVVLWATHALVIRGVQTAALVNTITTVAKIVPLAVFIIIVAFGFHYDLFTLDFWGSESADLGSIAEQTKSMMMVTVWVFIGIEGASIYSKRAAKRSDVGKATVLGFVFMLALLVAVNLLSLGVMKRAEVAGLPDISMGDVLAEVVGPWGSWLISIGVLISLIGALLAWILLCGETMQVPGSDGTMPKFFGKLNSHGAPANALWVTNILCQLFLLSTFFSNDVYLGMATLAAALILVPYLLSAGYALMVTLRGDTYTGELAKGRTRDLVVSIIATIYGFWLIYAAGIENLLLAALLYVPGAAVYIWARREKGEKTLFRGYELLILAVMVVAAVAAIVLIARGELSLI